MAEKVALRDRSGVAHLLIRHAVARIAAHHRLGELQAQPLASALRARGRGAAADAAAELAYPGKLLVAAGQDLVALSHALDASVRRTCL